MNFCNSFVKEDLNVFYMICDENDMSHNKTSSPFIENYYFLLYVTEGSCKGYSGADAFTLEKNQMILVDKNTYFSYRFNGDEKFEYTVIRIHPFILHRDIDDERFFRAFSDLPNENKIICMDSREFLTVKANAISVSECLRLRLGRAHILPRILAIISELCIYCDRIVSPDSKPSDSFVSKLLHYIDRHFTEDFSYERLMKKYFISKTTINRIMRVSTSMTLKQYIYKRRLDEAVIMLGRGWSAHKVAELVGFANYSTFYRAFVKEYKTPPIDLKNKSRHKWPMTK